MLADEDIRYYLSFAAIQPEITSKKFFIRVKWFIFQRLNLIIVHKEGELFSSRKEAQQLRVGERPRQLRPRVYIRPLKIIMTAYYGYYDGVGLADC